MTMMLLSLFYLHSKHIMHRDLKPENFLLDQLANGITLLKLCDFGLSKIFEDFNFRRTVTMQGTTTAEYISPEVLMGESETTKVDLWALGIIVYMMITSGKHPFVF